MSHLKSVSKGILAIAIVTLLIGSTYTADSLRELMKWEVVEENTYDLEFDQSTEFVSNKQLINENASIATTPERIRFENSICSRLQSMYSSWDCNTRNGGTNNDEKGWFRSDADILENEEYTINARVEYRYRLNHSGTISVKETITSTSGQSSTISHQLMGSDEVFNLSLKTSIVFEIHRRYTPVGYEHIIQTFSFNVPFPTLVDVDGDGTYRDLGFTIPVANTNRVYLWDNFTAISNATSVGQLGSNIDLSGYVNLVEIDLIQFAKSVLDSLGAGTGVALALGVLSYIIEVWLTISLDADFFLQSIAQIHIANDVNTLQQNTDTHSERVAGGELLSFSDGRNGDYVLPTSTTTTQTDPTADDLLTGLGFMYIANSTESYSVNIEIAPSSKRICVTGFCGSVGEKLWRIKGWPDPIRIPLAQGLFSSSSDHSETVMTTAVHSTSMPSLPTPPPPNTTPQASSSLSSTTLQTGQTLTVSTAGSQDADSDSLEAQVNWGDGSVSTWTSSNSHTHAYDSPGNYVVSVRVRDAMSMSESDTNTIVISEPPYLGDVSITSTSTQIEANNSMSFTVTLTNIASPSSILLSFGDNSNQFLTSGGTYSHTYTAPGLVSCSVLVQDGVHTVSDSISISVIPYTNPPAQVQSAGNVSASNYSEVASGDSSLGNSTTFSTNTESIGVEAYLEGAYVNSTSLSNTESYYVLLNMYVYTENLSSGQDEWMNLYSNWTYYSSPASSESWDVLWDHLWISGTHFVTAELLDSSQNVIANSSVELIFEIPDLPIVPISDSGVLLVIDTENQNYSAQNSIWSTSQTNPTDGEESLLQAAQTAANVLNIEFDLIYVGDTDRDGLFDSYGESGPSLGVMQQYASIIWITGTHYYPLQNEDEYNIAVYLNSGGSLILFSQDYLWGAQETLYQEKWDFTSFANRTLGIRNSNQDFGTGGYFTGENGAGNSNIIYLLTAGIEFMPTRSLMLNGSVQPFEDLIFPADDDAFTKEAMSTCIWDNVSMSNECGSVGITRMSIGEENGRLAFFAFDPAAIEYRYDLERLLIQSINWSMQQIQSYQTVPVDAIPIYIGMDGGEHIVGSGYTSNWYSIHPEPGREFHLEFSDDSIISVYLYDEAGTWSSNQRFQYSFSNNTHWIDFTSESNTVYTIEVSVSVPQGQGSVAIFTESSYLDDNNPGCWAYETGDYPPNLNVGSNPVSDILVPYTTQGPDYSNSCFETYLYSGQNYAITMTTSGEIISSNNNNDSLSYYLVVEDELGLNYWTADAMIGTNVLEAFISPTSSGYYTISAELFGYENPYLNDGNYEIQVWELPMSHPSDDTNSTATLLQNGFEYGWIDVDDDPADRITWDVFDGEDHDVWVQFDRTINGTLSAWWIPEDPNDSPYLIVEHYVSDGGFIEIAEEGMGSIILEIRAEQGRANYTVIVEEHNSTSTLPFGDILFSELGQIDSIDTWEVEIMAGLPVVVSMAPTNNLFALPSAGTLTTWAEDPDGNVIYPSTGNRYFFDNVGGGTYTIHVSGSGGGYWIWAFVDYEPQTITEPSTYAMVDELYKSQFEATHFIQSLTRGWYLNANLMYSIENGPSGLVIDSESGNLSMLPTQSDIGTHDVTILVETSWIIPLRYDFILTVDDQPNTPPVFDPIVDIVVTEGELVEFTLSAIDPEDDSMTISMYEGPDGAHFDSSSWTASWYPLQSGNYVVKFRILDARGASATTEVNITVLEPDQPIVRISATASDWSGIATEQAELTLDVQLENATEYDCTLLNPQPDLRVDLPCTLVWYDIPEGNHVVGVLIESGLAQLSIDVNFFVSSVPIIDSDGDGIPDESDYCPNTTIGTVDSVGCADWQKDDDGDGLSNADDTCPNTLSSELSSVDISGCGPSQRDSDGDGINDNLDDCPDESGVAWLQGCPVIDNNDQQSESLDSESESGFSSTLLIGLIAIITMAIIALVFVIASRRGSGGPPGFDNLGNVQQMSTAPPPSVATAPPPPPPPVATAPPPPPPPVATAPPPVAVDTPKSAPRIDSVGQPDAHGFEWTKYNESQWYRKAGSSDEWEKWVD